MYSLHALQTFHWSIYLWSLPVTWLYLYIKLSWKKVVLVIIYFSTCMYVLPPSAYSSQYFNLNLRCLLSFFFCFSFFKVGIDIAKLDGIIDDLDFTEKLISEQSVFCLPGKVKYGKFPRISLTDIHVAVWMLKPRTCQGP